MMTNLFSVFDPSSSVGVSLNWFTMSLGMMGFPMMKWSKGSRASAGVNFIYKGLNKEMIPILSIKGKMFLVIFSALFFFILSSNLVGLFPYIFTSTSHLAITLSLALPLWLGYFSYGWINNLSHMLAHLTPQGTPAMLMPFMVLIESVSSLIRPGTLAVRLMANMIAGHLLLTLISSAIQVFSLQSVVLITVSQILLIVLEVAVAMIQSYVLVMLSVLYTSEI